MYTLCYTAIYHAAKNTPDCCELKCPKSANIPTLESNPRSSLLSAVSVRFFVFVTLEIVRETHWFATPKELSIDPAQSRSEIDVLCVNKSRIFSGTGTRAIQYSIDIKRKLSTSWAVAHRWLESQKKKIREIWQLIGQDIVQQIWPLPKMLSHISIL